MERDSITLTERTQEAILRDINASAKRIRGFRQMRVAEAVNDEERRFDRLYEELRAARSGLPKGFPLPNGTLPTNGQRRGR